MERRARNSTGRAALIKCRHQTNGRVVPAPGNTNASDVEEGTCGEADNGAFNRRPTKRAQLASAKGLEIGR